MLSILVKDNIIQIFKKILEISCFEKKMMWLLIFSVENLIQIFSGSLFWCLSVYFYEHLCWPAISTQTCQNKIHRPKYWKWFLHGYAQYIHA